MSAPNICARCVMPESPPEITFNAQGVCSLCQEHARAAAQTKTEAQFLESDFTKILAKNKGTGQFDCLVMCSGGKDSTAALFYMVRKYKARVLAFTFDNGFETEDALSNVRRAVQILKVDFLTYSSTFMHDMFEKVLRTNSQVVLCHLCSMWYMDLSYKMAARFDIPIIIAGWTKGQKIGRAHV